MSFSYRVSHRCEHSRWLSSFRCASYMVDLLINRRIDKVAIQDLDRICLDRRACSAVLKQTAEGLSVVDSADGLGKDWSHVQYFELGTYSPVLVLGY